MTNAIVVPSTVIDDRVKTNCFQWHAGAHGVARLRRNITIPCCAPMRTNFPIRNIIFEFTESEQLDTPHLYNILQTYRDMGFRTAIDDFGAGHAGLGLLADFQPDIAKLDMALIRGIDTDDARQKIVKHTVAMLDDLGVTPLCEGIETVAELQALQVRARSSSDRGADPASGAASRRPCRPGADDQA